MSTRNTASPLLPLIALALTAAWLSAQPPRAPGSFATRGGLPPTQQLDWTDRLQRYEGIAGPSREAVLGVAIDGVIASVAVDEGASVKMGDLIALMDDRVQQAIADAADQQAASNARVRAAEIDLDNATRELDGLKQAMDQGGANEIELQRNETIMRQAQVTLDNANELKRIDELEADAERARLAQHRILAPFDGLVVRTIAEEGEAIERAGDVALLIKTDPLKAEIYLPAAAWDTLETGLTYRLTAQDPINRELNGQLTLIDPLIDSASRKVRCVFEIPNPDSSMPAGFAVHLADLTPVEPEARTPTQNPIRPHQPGNTASELAAGKPQ